MKTLTLIRPCAIAAAACASMAFAQETVQKPVPKTLPETAAVPAAARPPAVSARPTTIYRQVLPDGRIVYSDETVSGARLDHTIRMAAPIEGNLWTTEPGARPAIPPQTVPTPVRRVPIAPARAGQGGAVPVSDAALAEVMRAEMLLEDARKRQADGVKPLPAELRDNRDGGPATNQAYMSRQKRLARDVAYAEEQLQKAKEARAGGR